jgi:transcriptional regulator with XRE-family HTH domain
MTYNLRMIASRLQELKRQKHYRTEDIAKQAGLSYCTVADILSGTNANPRLETMAKIADVMGVDVLHFIKA